MAVYNAPVLARVEAFFHSAKRRGSGWEKWEVLSMKVREELGSPYSGSVEIATEALKVDFSKLVGMSCALELRRAGINRRYFKGIVYRVERLGDQYDHAIARVDFAAALWGLRYGRDTQIFENVTAPKIIEEVLRKGLGQFRREARFNLTRTYRKREYCVQWKESDWQFVQRLMVLEGIFCYFEQGKGLDETETVVFVDDNRSLPWIETMAAPVTISPMFVPVSLSLPATKPPHGPKPLVHVVKQGEYFSLIAARYGYDWKSLYEHPTNAALKRKRPDHNILLPGDEVTIPEPKAASGGTADELVLVLRTAQGQALGGEICRVEPMNAQGSSLTPEPLTTKTSNEGELRLCLPVGAAKVKLSLPNHSSLKWWLAIGNLDPLRDTDEGFDAARCHVTGIQARLNNLGCFCGVADGRFGPRTKAAIASFQRRALNRNGADGTLDDETCSKLVSEHGS